MSAAQPPAGVPARAAPWPGRADAITADDILAHPGFVEARRRHVDAVVALFRGDPFVTAMMADAGVIILRGFLVAFHLAFDAGDPSTWATPGNLRRALVERGLASPRRVDDLLARFRHAGYALPAPAPGDRRSSVLLPSEALVAHDRRHLAAYHGLLLDLFPGRGYGWALTGDAAAHRAFRVASLSALPQALSALTHEAMRPFLARDAGYLALLLAIQGQLAGRDDGPSWTAMAGELGVSRSHLRALFADVEAAGHVRLGGGRRPVEVLPPLWRAFDGFVAGVAAGQDAVARLAFAGRI